MLKGPRPSPLKASAQVLLICVTLSQQRYNYEFLDIEENGVRLRLTVVDTPGFGDFVNNDDRLFLVIHIKELS